MNDKQMALAGADLMASLQAEVQRQQAVFAKEIAEGRRDRSPALYINVDIERGEVCIAPEQPPETGAAVPAHEITALFSDCIAEDGRRVRIYDLTCGRTGAQVDDGPIWHAD